MKHLLFNLKGSSGSQYKTLTTSIKSVFLICLMICVSSFLRAQQDSLWTAGNRMIDMDNETDFPVAETLPTSTNGFQGGVARYATNVQYDEEGNLLFFIIDGRIYDEDGEQIADSELDSNCQECLPKGMHDVSIVKRPGTCDQYYIFWGHRTNPSAFNYGLEMALLDLRVVSDEEVENCGLEPTLVNWTDLTNTYGNNNPDHPFYDFINQLFPNGQVSTNPDDPDVASDPINPRYGVYGSYHSDSDYIQPHLSVSDYTVSIPVSEESGNHTTRLDFDIVDGNLAGEKTLFVMTSKRLTVYKINSQGVFFEEDFTTPGNDFESDDQGEGKRQFIAMEAIKHNVSYYVAISDGGAFCDASDDMVYDPNDANGRNLYFLSIDPFDYTIFSQDKIDTHKELEAGKIGDLAFSTEGSYLYFNTEYSIDDNDDPFLYHLDIDDLLFNGTVNIGSVTTPTLSDYDRLELASAQIMAHEYNDKPSIYYVNKDGALGYLCVLEGSDDPTNSTYHHDEILLGPIGSSLVDGGAGFEDSNNNNLNFYALNKQNFAPQQAEELAMEDCCEWQDLNQHELLEGYTTSANEDWDADNNPFDTDGENTVTFCDDLVFEDGAIIDIEDMNFIFTEDASMILEAGAYVRLNGTTLTSLCEKMWPGVVVQGDANLDQQPAYAGDQGYLRMINSSLIENAIEGVALGSSLNLNNQDAGGIIRAIDSEFRNNETDVIFYPYENIANYGSNLLLNNASYFDNCNFLTDSKLNEESLHPKDHVVMWLVDGIRISDCSFLNTVDYDDYSGSERGNGIVSWASTFEVSGQTDKKLGLNDNDHTTFYKLYHGIQANSCETYVATDMAFQLNSYGIYNSYSDNAEIYENELDIPDSDPSKYGVKIPVGIFLTNSTGYKVTRNELIGMEHPATAVGCWVDNSNYGGIKDDNYIYKNELFTLKMATYVTNLNALEDDVSFGLQVMCNFYKENETDVFVDEDSEWRDNQGGGQLGQPGSMEAGNRFSEPYCGVSSDVVIDSENEGLTYYHPHVDVITKPDCQSISSIQGPFYNQSLLNVLNASETFSSTECPIDFADHDLGGYEGCPTCEVPVELGVVIDGLTDVEDDIAETQGIYQVTVDKDDTESILQALDNAYSSESSYIRDLLLEKYPLSKETLMKLIEEGEHMDDWHLTQIFVANARLERDVILFLEDSELLSDFFMDFIYDAQDGDNNLRLVLEAQLSGLQQQRNLLRQKLTRNYQLTFTDPSLALDSVAVIHKGAYKTLWESYPDHMTRIKSFIDKMQLDSAQFLVDEIEDTDRRAYWKDYVDLIDAMDGNWRQADSSHITTIHARWSNKDNPLSPLYLGMLNALHATTESLNPNFPVQYRSLSIAEENSERAKKKYLKVYPNPANVEAFIGFPIEAQGIGRIEVRNIDGRMIRNIDLEMQNGVISLATSKWANGLYLISLYIDDKQIDTQKLSIVH